MKEGRDFLAYGLCAGDPPGVWLGLFSFFCHSGMDRTYVRDKSSSSTLSRLTRALATIEPDTTEQCTVHI